MNLKTIGAGLVLLALAGWQFTTHGIGVNTLIFAAGGIAVVAFGAMGRTIEANQARDTADFLTDPGGAIVDAATDRLGEWLGDVTKPKQEEFDPDAAIARYMANRPEPAPAAAEPRLDLPRFGRKGVGSVES
ncbi:MAG TPA: hypothetical protein VGD23_10160 [Sphingomicrobium sp.]